SGTAPAFAGATHMLVATSTARAADALREWPSIVPSCPPHTAHLVASALPEQLRNTAPQVPGSEDLRLCPGRVEPGKVDCGGPLAVTVGRVLTAGVIACCAC